MRRIVDVIYLIRPTKTILISRKAGRAAASPNRYSGGPEMRPTG